MNFSLDVTSPAGGLFRAEPLANYSRRRAISQLAAGGLLHCGAVGRLAVGRDDAQRSVGVGGAEDHAAALHAHQFARREVGDEAYLLALQLLGLVHLGDAAHDDAVLARAVVDIELEELVAALDLLAVLHRADAQVELLKVGEGRHGLVCFGLGLLQLVGALCSLQLVHLSLHSSVVYLLEEQFGLCELMTFGDERRRTEVVPVVSVDMVGLVPSVV